MPFGKHRGVEISELPGGYLRWLADLDLREPLRSEVQVERARREGRRDQEFSQPPDFRLGSDDRKTARQIVDAGRRALAKTAHPDRGGELSTMQRVNVVADALLEAFQ